MSQETDGGDKITVRLVGGSGNAFAIIGSVSRELRRAGRQEQAAEFQQKARACGSYDALLQLVMETVEVE